MRGSISNNNFKESLKNVGILIVTHYSGLKTTQTDELRIQINEVGGKFLIVKNSLMKIIFYHFYAS